MPLPRDEKGNSLEKAKDQRGREGELARQSEKRTMEMGEGERGEEGGGQERRDDRRTGGHDRKRD